MEQKIYYKLKLSQLDKSIPDSWIKINIVKFSKDWTNNCNGISTYLCSNGGCSSEWKPCSNYNGCPYLVVRKMAQPHRNNRSYKDYAKELDLQMTAKYLQKINDKKLEIYLNGELPEHEYIPLVNLLADNLKSYEVDYHHNKIFYDIQKELKRRESDKAKQNSIERRIIYDINEYFYIQMDNLPEIKIDEKSVWYQLMGGYGWILRDNFDEYIWDKISNRTFYQFGNNSYSENKYKESIKILEEQLEKFYGLITMFKLTS